MSEEDKPAERTLPSIPGLPIRADAELAQDLPGLLRVAGQATVRTATWAVGTTVRTGLDVVRRTLEGEPPASVIHHTTAELREFAWKSLGLEDLEPKRIESTKDTDPKRQRESNGGGVGSLLGQLNPGNSRGTNSGYRRAVREDASTESLRARGDELLRQSADVDVAEEGHPAYARILTELTPDEARILRFLYRDGPQPAIDIRTNRPFGIGSEKIAGGLSMIGEYAGLRHLDRIHPYLTNLFRLGLIQFSKEQVRDPSRYQVIEAQPRMTEAMAKAGRAPKIIRRSILLNSFGNEFCQVCLFDTE